MNNDDDDDNNNDDDEEEVREDGRAYKFAFYALKRVRNLSRRKSAVIPDL